MIVLTTREPEINSRIQTPGVYTTITLVTFKQWLKWNADDTSEDIVMQLCLTSAIQQAEAYTRRSIDRATWRTYLEGFYNVTLDVAPIDTTTGYSVKYFDVNNVEQTLATNKYTLINKGLDSYAEIEFESDPPELYDRNEPVYIEYLAGYTAYPVDLTAIILSQATDFFENRSNDLAGSLNQVTMDFHKRLFPYKML